MCILEKNLINFSITQMRNVTIAYEFTGCCKAYWSGQDEHFDL